MTAGALAVFLIVVLGLAWAGFCWLVRRERGHVITVEGRMKKLARDLAAGYAITLEEAQVAIARAPASFRKLNALERKPRP